MTLKFRRKVEDFVCEYCGQEVKGNGYTNHCPKCLWCKHVDIFPGDRNNSCLGLMEPVGLELERGIYQIIHRCKRCGEDKKTKAVAEDDISSYLTSMLQ